MLSRKFDSRWWHHIRYQHTELVIGKAGDDPRGTRCVRKNFHIDPVLGNGAICQLTPQELCVRFFDTFPYPILIARPIRD